MNRCKSLFIFFVKIIKTVIQKGKFMNKYKLFLLVFAISYQVSASQSYNKLMDLVRQNMSIEQHCPHDLTEYGAQVILSKNDVYGDREEILQLSDAGFNLVAALTQQEKEKLPKILIATPGSYAMKFYHFNGCCSKRYVMDRRPTEEELDRKSHEVKF